MIGHRTSRRILFVATAVNGFALPVSAMETDHLRQEIWQHGGQPCIESFARFRTEFGEWDNSFAFAVQNPVLHCSLLEAMKVMELMLRGNIYEAERMGAYPAFIRMCRRMLQNPSRECGTRN